VQTSFRAFSWTTTLIPAFSWTTTLIPIGETGAVVSRLSSALLCCMLLCVCVEDEPMWLCLFVRRKSWNDEQEIELILHCQAESRLRLSRRVRPAVVTGAQGCTN
jgi:hypothetical protein